LMPNPGDEIQKLVSGPPEGTLRGRRTLPNGRRTEQSADRARGKPAQANAARPAKRRTPARQGARAGKAGKTGKGAKSVRKLMAASSCWRHGRQQALAKASKGHNRLNEQPGSREQQLARASRGPADSGLATPLSLPRVENP